jgi:phage/plasmid-associated DNA primase
MRVTFFKNKAAKSLEVEDLTLEQLQDKIVVAEAPTKQKLHWLKLATFGNKRGEGGSLRNNDNVEKVSGAELDYDGEKLTIQQGKALFEEHGIRALLHSSPSNSIGKPRWRALLPFSRELQPADRTRIVQSVMKTLGNIFAAESVTLSQSYYFGHVAGTPPIEAVITSGDFADVVLSNPYLNFDPAELQGVGIDVDAELDAMRYRDPEHPIHNTQLRCIASMLSRGEDEDSVSQKVLEATKIACIEAGHSWERWEGKERKAVQGMIDSWVKKLAEKEAAYNVITLPGAQSKKVGKKEIHVYLAAMFCQSLRNKGEDVLRISDEGWWVFQEGYWKSRLGNEWIEARIGQLMKLAKITPTARMVREVLAEIERVTARDSVEWDAHGMLPVANGMLDLKTRQLRPSEADDHARRRLPVAYDAEAQCPVWLKMLEDRFDAATIAVLQENLGAALLPKRNKDQRRGLILVGPSDGGKSGYLDVVCGLLSKTVIVTSLGDINKPHGTMMFHDKFAPWRLDEAFAQRTWHPTPLIKKMMSGEPFEINVKKGPLLMVIWDGACFWATNAPVQFEELTRAMENRVLIVNCDVIFDPKNPVGAALAAHERGYRDPSDLVLAEEMPGVLNWALEGAERIAARGYYDLPEQLESNLEEFREDSNPLVSFFRDCIVFDPKSCVSIVDLHYAFTSYTRDEMKTISTKSLGRFLKSLGDPRVAIDHKKLRQGACGKRRFYGCIRLNDLGLEHWSSRMSELSFKGQHAPGASNTETDVNGEIPRAWGRFSAILKARKAIKVTSK